MFLNQCKIQIMQNNTNNTNKNINTIYYTIYTFEHLNPHKNTKIKNFKSVKSIVVLTASLRL